MVSLCQCGCGGEIPWKKHHKQRPPSFLHGHNGKTAAHSADKMAARITPPDGWIRPTGLCECGCGLATPIATHTRASIGHYSGFPVRFIRGHNPRGKRAHGWKGGRKRTSGGYWLLYRPEHPNAQSGGYVFEHRIVWEDANGRLLRPNEDVHHIDGDPGNNDPNNLVALTKQQHMKLHSDREDTRHRKRRGQNNRFADPEQRRKQSEACRRSQGSPEARQLQSERMKIWWAERKKRISQG